MTKAATTSLVLAAASLLLGWSHAADLVEPTVISSVNGELNTVISLQRASITRDGVTLNTRLFNGELPGPTLRIKAGDVLNVRFENNLIDQGIGFVHNSLSAPDESNLHFHGLHISGELPSDDVSLHLSPGQAYDYLIELPADHLPGTHWYHPHRHGSTTLQVGGGATAAVIVEDPPGFLPADVASARDTLLVVNQVPLRDIRSAARDSGDGYFSISGGPSNQFLMTNGQVNPTIRAAPGEWLRLRVVFAGWEEDDLRMTVNGCEMQLLAKDGIYIRDFPRAINNAAVAPGGRADVMVRCTAAQSTISGWGSTVATIVTQGAAVQSSALQPWTVPYPSYLSDLRSTPASPGCTCSTELDDRAVNGRSFNENQILHSSSLGSVIQRNVDADDHPYHQHVYPYQLISVSGNNAYNRPGDWHDTILGTATVRHQATRFAGKIMIHCHRLEHEDEGMMAMEWIDPNPNAGCSCGFRAAPGTVVTNAPITPRTTPAPVTLAPVSSAPVTAPPVTAAPVTAAPVTPSPSVAPSRKRATKFCFPRSAVVETADRGEVSMDDVSLGDKVLTNNGNYEPIYSFGHKNEQETGEFVRVSVLAQETDERLHLELSRQHMLLVNSSRFLPASMVQVGDNVTVADGGLGTVYGLSSVRGKGLYAPFTPSGTLVVNGVVASSFVALQESETLVVGGWSTPFTLQWLAHIFEAPHRMACLVGLCESESYSEDGVSQWVSRPLEFSEWILEREWSGVVLFPLVGVFFLIAVMERMAREGAFVFAGLTTLAVVVFSTRHFRFKFQAK